MGNCNSTSSTTPDRHQAGCRDTDRLVQEDLTSSLSIAPSSYEAHDYPSSGKRRIALAGILLCQMFLFVAFRIILLWIPQTLQLNAHWWSDGDPGYYTYINR